MAGCYLGIAMADFRVDLKVRNGRILRRMNAAGIWSVAEFARRMNYSDQSLLGAIINLKEPPFNLQGEWRPIVQRMAEALNCMPDELFSPAQREMRLKSNKGYIEATEVEIGMLIETRRQAALPADEKVAKQELMEKLNKAISELSPKEAKIISMRYGLEGNPQTLEEIGNEFSVTRERVRQIMFRGERKLREKMNG